MRQPRTTVHEVVCIIIIRWKGSITQKIIKISKWRCHNNNNSRKICPIHRLPIIIRNSRILKLEVKICHLRWIKTIITMRCYNNNNNSIESLINNIRMVLITTISNSNPIKFSPNGNQHLILNSKTTPLVNPISVPQAHIITVNPSIIQGYRKYQYLFSNLL